MIYLFINVLRELYLLELYIEEGKIAKTDTEIMTAVHGVQEAQLLLGDRATRKHAKDS